MDSAKKFLIELEEFASRNSSEAEIMLTSTNGQTNKSASSTNNLNFSNSSIRKLPGQQNADPPRLTSKISRHLFADIAFEVIKSLLYLTRLD